MVEKKTHPPGLTKSAQAFTTEAGSGTCSSISIHVTVSKWPGNSAAKISALTSRYSIFGVWASSACRRATRKALDARSHPAHGHLYAMESDRMPPPHPISTTRAPLSGERLLIQSSRNGLIWCSGRNSPSASHQRCAKAENFSNSAGSAFYVEHCSHRCLFLPKHQPWQTTRVSPGNKKAPEPELRGFLK